MKNSNAIKFSESLQTNNSIGKLTFPQIGFLLKNKIIFILSHYYDVNLYGI